MEDKQNGAFWPSYVDIMTTLFAIMLVLFAVSFSRFKIKEKQLNLLVDEYKNIIDVYSTVGSIDSTRYFGYNSEYLKHLFTVNVEYQQKQYSINQLQLDLTNTLAANAKRDSIVEAGRLVMNTIRRLESKEKKEKQENIKFLVVIEGQSSKIRFDQDDWHNNYTLSYLRAQHLNEFWKENGIDIAAIPRCELIISGSGEGGVPRDNVDERRNQRFLIHIVPVIGNIDVTREKINQLQGESQ